MATIVSGATADVMTVDPTFKAARVSIRPPEVTGAYRLAQRSGIIAASTAATSILYAFRYTGTGVAVISSVRVGLNVTTGYTAGSIVFSIWATRSYTVTETTAYTAATLTTNNAKLRTSFATCAVAAGICTTTTISGGTGTDDAQPLSAVTFNLPATITGQPVQDFFNFNLQSYPLVCAQNEGFRIRNDTAFAATGASNLVVSIEWFEASAY